MLQKLVSIAAWACLAFIVFATLSPAHLRPELTATEPTGIVVLERIGAFALLGILFSFSYPRNRIFVSVVVFGSAILLELFQVIIPDRDARLIDAVEKLTGGAVGMLLATGLFFLPVRTQTHLVSWVDRISLKALNPSRIFRQIGK